MTLRSTEIDLGSRTQEGAQQGWGQTGPGSVPTRGTVGVVGEALPWPAHQLIPRLPPTDHIRPLSSAVPKACVWAQKGEGEEKHWNGNITTCKQTAAPHRQLNLGLSDNLQGCSGGRGAEREAIYVYSWYLGLIHALYGRNQQIIVKQSSSN